MAEFFFEFQSFAMLQNDGFSLGFLVSSFTIVEENFEFHSFEMCIYAYTLIRNAPANLV